MSMKFTCSQQSLSKALNTVSKAVTSRTTMPILKGILLQASSDGTLTLTASDLEISIEKTMNVSVQEEGSIVVLSKLFSDIVRKLPSGEVLIEERENNQILIKTSSSEFTIVGLSAEEFPEPEHQEETSFSLSFPKELFKSMIQKTSFAASIEESKGIIIGVLIELEEDSVNFAALDGFRMAVTREKMNTGQQNKIIISAKILNEVNKIIAENDDAEDINIIFGEKTATIFAADTKVMIRLLEGEFIKYKDIIPANQQTRVRIGKSELLDSIERASLLAKEGRNNLIKFTVNNNLLTITSRSDEGNVKEEIIMEKEGPDLEIGFNAKYVIDVLKVIGDEEIFMEFNTGITPCLVKPIEGDAFEYLILPVRISSH